MDSFAGSGTTGQAVMQMNKNDGGSRRFVLVEMDTSISKTITAQRLRSVAQGYDNAEKEHVEGLGGGFRFCELGASLFDTSGAINPDVKYADLARHVYFTETGEPLPRGKAADSPLLGVCGGVAIYLLFNGILGDKRAKGGNILTRAVLAGLPKHDGHKVVYGAGCLISKERLRELGITFHQTPYEIRIA